MDNPQWTVDGHHGWAGSHGRHARTHAAGELKPEDFVVRVQIPDQEMVGGTVGAAVVLCKEDRATEEEDVEASLLFVISYYLH